MARIIGVNPEEQFFVYLKKEFNTNQICIEHDSEIFMLTVEEAMHLVEMLKYKLNEEISERGLKERLNIKDL